MSEKEDLDSRFNELWLDEKPVAPRYVPPPPPKPQVIEKVVEKIVEVPAPPPQIQVVEKVVEKVVYKDAPVAPKKPRKPRAKKVVKIEEPPKVVEAPAPKPIPPPPPNPIPVNERFEDLKTMVQLVAKGVRPALFLSGQAGSAKSFTVLYVLEQILKLKEGEDYFLCKGETTPKGIYSTLLKWNGKLLVCDDSDAAFTNITATNLLKGALDSMPLRRIVWISNTSFDPAGLTEEEYKKKISEGKYPGYFDYTGKIIFISNIKFEDVHPAIKSRSLVQNIELTREEFVEQMKVALPDIRPEIDMHVKEHILHTLVKTYTNTNKEFSFRTLVTAIELKANGVEDWLKIVSRYG